MDLAYAAGRAGGTMTGVLSAANEKAVELFIDEKYVNVLVEIYSCNERVLFLALYGIGWHNGPRFCII